MNKQLLPTAVLRYYEKSAKLTFIFRKKLYFSRKHAVPKLATDAKRRNVSRHPRATQNANDKHKKKYKKEKSFANAKPFLF